MSEQAKNVASLVRRLRELVFAWAGPGAIPKADLNDTFKCLQASADYLEGFTAQLAAQGEALTQAQARSSHLEDAAFHFQSCVTCARDGEDSCTSGRRFAAYLRGEDDLND